MACILHLYMRSSEILFTGETAGGSVMGLRNCWEFKKCGREPGGQQAIFLGVCPVATASEYAGMNRGDNAGRYCWRIAGTFCEGKVEGVFAHSLMSCSFCEFYKSVQDAEGDGLNL